MSKITKLDKPAMQNLRAPLEAELAALGERLGLKFQIGNGSFDGGGAEASFKLLITVDDPVAKEAAAKARWDANCKWVGYNFDKPETTGLRPEDFGTEFEVKGVRYRTAGIAVKRSKYPVEVEVLTGPKAGTRPAFTDAIVPTIRAATDAARAKAAA